jgi:hypothetical protein
VSRRTVEGEFRRRFAATTLLLSTDRELMRLTFLANGFISTHPASGSTRAKERFGCQDSTNLISSKRGTNGFFLAAPGGSVYFDGRKRSIASSYQIHAVEVRRNAVDFNSDVRGATDRTLTLGFSNPPPLSAKTCPSASRSCQETSDHLKWHAVRQERLDRCVGHLGVHSYGVSRD